MKKTTTNLNKDKRKDKEQKAYKQIACATREFDVVA